MTDNRTRIIFSLREYCEATVYRKTGTIKLIVSHGNVASFGRITGNNILKCSVHESAPSDDRWYSNPIFHQLAVHTKYCNARDHLTWTTGNGDPMYEVCITHRIPRAWKQQG